MTSQGLLSRLLVAAPESTAGTRLYGDPAEEARADLAVYRRRLAELVAAPYPIREGTRNELVPRQLPLNPEARQIWIGFHDHIEMRLSKDGELSPISGLANKAPEHAARLAALLTLWLDINATAVRMEEMANATKCHAVSKRHSPSVSPWRFGVSTDCWWPRHPRSIWNVARRRSRVVPRWCTSPASSGRSVGKASPSTRSGPRGAKAFWRSWTNSTRSASLRSR